MKRFAWWGGLALSGLLCVGVAPVAADDVLTLPVVDSEGNEYDVIEQSDGDALVAFLSADKLADEDVDGFVEAIEALASGDEEGEEDDDAMATLRQFGVVRLADEDDDEAGEDADEDWNFVVVVLGDEEDWDAIEAELGDVPDDVHVVLADPELEALEAWELPDDLVWAAYLVQDGQITKGFETVEVLNENADAIVDELDD